MITAPIVGYIGCTFKNSGIYRSNTHATTIATSDVVLGCKSTLTSKVTGFAIQTTTRRTSMIAIEGSRTIEGYYTTSIVVNTTTSIAGSVTIGC